MLGKTAGGLFWMFRYLERTENTARMLDAGLRIALTRSAAAESEWKSIITATGLRKEYEERHGSFTGPKIIDFLLRDKQNPGSTMAAVVNARNNARLVRTALTRELWEAVNESYMVLKDVLAHPITDRELPGVLQTIRQHAAIVRGTLAGTMLRNDIYDFARIGTFFERADNTARTLDVKYYILLPSVRHVGSPADNVQWEAILRSVSSVRAYQSVHHGDTDPRSIAEFLILDRRSPRSLAFCYDKIVSNLGYLSKANAAASASMEQANTLNAMFQERDIDAIFTQGLHEFTQCFLRESFRLGQQIEQDYRFTE
ncbi:alpha-E domain-containing protein [Alphaproteobacteria bacterium KMM 3653]|uniref:Alpha-E domain-containing protein n=1 Tax=Harenicola maris TaxID=2841044 RepID=A0AAP2CS75_9RHOB|nr:alpha-E domain-containing protein [Harenicola maris]